jgi:signal transduction histidine kinase/ActR/RegA family two-component response regulator
VGKIRLRTKFLISLVAISAGLTTATLLIVRYTVQKQVREAIRDDLDNSVNTYKSFEVQREIALTHSAELIADLPLVRALMTTQHGPTIQDASEGIWQLSGSDLLILAGRQGNVLGMKARSSGLSSDIAQELLHHSLERGDPRDWWYGGGHLYQVWTQTIYFGQSSDNAVIGYLALGHEINAGAAREFSAITSSEVAFLTSDAVVASTLAEDQQAALIKQIWKSSAAAGNAPQEVQLGNERYLARTVTLSLPGSPSVSLSVLKSFDKASAFLSELNRVLLGLGLLTVFAGSGLVFLISETFTRPLASLVEGVRALEQGDFNFPLDSVGGAEVAEVTGAFDRMRVSLRKTQNDQKQLEERLRQAHKMEAVGRLAGGVAHDFNNLLTVIRGHCDLLVDFTPEAGPHRRNVEQIQKAAGRAVGMTRQLLAFSRMQVLQPRILDLNSIVTDMAKMLPRLVGEQIEYVFQPAADLAMIKADPGQVEQVILNLVVNARDAMASGGTLTVRTQNIAVTDVEARKRPPMAPGRYVLLSISDTGIGMSAEVKAHIFEPFFTTKEVGKGTGLGLATVYGVVKQSGGFIWVESAPGKGATFEIYFPPASEKTADVDADAKRFPLARGSGTILLVEDESDVRELACEFLKLSGYTVLEAQNGVEALVVARRHTGPIHLVVSDMVMPRMGGAELAQKLKGLRPGLKVVLMSGYTDYSDPNNGANSLQAVMIPKPFSQNSLVEAVRGALEGKSSEQGTPRGAGS